MKLNKEFPRKLYLDTKVLVNGNKKKPRDLNLEKHIELGKWVQDMINEGSIEIPCECNSCNITATNDVFKFEYNSLEYQFIDVLKNDIINVPDIKNITIVIVDASVSDTITLSIFNSQFYPYPIIKVVRPASIQEVGNIDTPEIFTYKIIGECSNGESVESNIATVTLLPISVNLELYIKETP